MSTSADERPERRLLVLAPVGKDAALVETMLRREGVACLGCSDVDTLERELARGAAAILVTEEALPHDTRLAELIARQPPWSDLPVLVLTRPGADSATAGNATRTLGNVTLLERPVRTAALASAVRSALRARERQYQTRAHLLEREDADRRKDEFLATLAHELRNPLAPIRNSVDAMRLSGAAQGAGQIWEMMDRQVEHMVRLVDDLMEVSRITRGKIELRREDVPLRDVITAAVETSRPLIEAARHQLTQNIEDAPLLVYADPVRLAQVFANLLNNAVKYTDAGGSIRIAAKAADGSAVVSISDTGIGISAEALPRVFDMFVQGDASDSRAKTGLGVGLTLARSLIELHGGSVVARSAGAGRGSEFTVRLPLARREKARNEARSTGTRAIPGLPRVLVVDDNRDAAQSLSGLLQVLGAEVQVTHDGPAALEALGAFRPAVVFLDLGMPGMDGYETARHIRARPEGRTTMLVALTGWGQDRDRRQTEASGFDQHLVKPADATVLRAVLAGLPGRQL